MDVTKPALRSAWDKFHETMAQMRERMQSTPRFCDTPQHRAKAYHALLETQAMAYNFAVAPRLDHPRFLVNTGWQTNFFALGQNGPYHYTLLFLDGRQCYRMSGRMGEVRAFLVQMHNKLTGPPDARTTATYDVENFELGGDRSFEITLSATPVDGNWIALDTSMSYQFVLIRRLIGDWNDDVGELRIDMTSTPPVGYYDYDEFDEDAMAERIVRAADFARYIVEEWNIGLYDRYLAQANGRKNTLGSFPGTATSQMGSPLSNYAMGIYELQDDEALLLELREIPDSAYWGFQLADVWSRSLDMMHHQTDVNMHHAAIDSDGVFRAVACRADPGVANWLDTRGRVEGTIVFRNFRSKSSPVPTARKIKFSEILDNLPKDTRRVTVQQRKQSLEQRRAGFLKLHRE